MYKVICDSEIVQKLTNVNVNEQLITSNLFRDCFGGRKSVVIETDDNKHYLIADDLDKCDWDYRAKNLDRIFYYYTYLTYEGPKGKRPDGIYKTFEDALSACIPNDETIVLPGDIGVDYYDGIKELYKVQDDFDNVADKKFYVYARECKDILNQIHENDEDINKKAIELMIDKKSIDILKPYLKDKKDTRFESLNKLMKELNLTACIFSSPLNVQEITGLSYTEVKEKEVYAYFNMNDTKVYIVSGLPLENRKEDFISENFKDAFRNADLSTKVGVGEGHLMISRFKQLGAEDPVYITDPLRTWREERSGEDLAYYIIVAKTTAYAIDGAVKYALDRHSRYERFTEKDVYEEYTKLKYEFIRKNDIEVDLEIYDPCTYETSRSVYPGVPSDYVVPTDGYTIRIDNGEFIKDKYGYIHAVSDICRTVCFNEPAKKAYKVLFDILENKIIPNIKVGMKFSEIWSMGVQYISENEQMLKDLGIIPPEVPFEDLYKRNIGHGISKQTRTANFITEHNDFVLKDGTVGNIELPINYRGNIVCVEDMWFATNKGTINITTG